MSAITRSQRVALHRLFLRQAAPYSTETYRTFRRRFLPCYGGYLGGFLHGIFYGIEPDGYCHT